MIRALTIYDGNFIVSNKNCISLDGHVVMVNRQVLIET